MGGSHGINCYKDYNRDFVGDCAIYNGNESMCLTKEECYPYTDELDRFHCENGAPEYKDNINVKVFSDDSGAMLDSLKKHFKVESDIIQDDELNQILGDLAHFFSQG